MPSAASVVYRKRSLLFSEMDRYTQTTVTHTPLKLMYTHLQALVRDVALNTGYLFSLFLIQAMKTKTAFKVCLSHSP